MDKTLHSIRHLRTMRQWPDLLERTGLFQARCFQTDVAQKIKPVKYKYPPVYDPYGARPPPSDKVSELAERIAALTSEERAQIGPALRASFNHPKLEKISTEGLDLGAQTAAGAPAEEIKAEKTSFDVRLQKFDPGSKLKVIKEVRAITSLGLKEAKSLVEKAEKEPAILAQGLTKDEAAALVEKINAVGGFAAAD